MDQQQLYFDLYREYRNELRHQETQRSTVSSILVGIAAGLIGLSVQEKASTARPYLGLLLLNFSLVAILMLRKLYERFALGRERAQLYLTQVDRCPQLLHASDGRLVQSKTPSLMWLWEVGQESNEIEYSFMSFVRLHYLWESLLIAAGLVGAALFCQWNIGRYPLWQLSCLILGGPLFQMVILVAVQKREKNKEIKRRKKPLSCPVTRVKDELINQRFHVPSLPVNEVEVTQPSQVSVEHKRT